MPKKIYKKSTKKRTYKRRNYRTRPRRRYNINRPVKLYQPVPTRALVKFNYVSTDNITVNYGAFVQQYFRTSLFDPDLTLGGHQPLWYDQFATLYKRYRVYGLKYHISLCPSIAGATTFVHVSHCPFSYSSTTNWNTEAERKDCKHRGTMSLDTGRLSNFVAKGYIDVAKVEGLGRKDFGGHEDYEAAFGANPAKYSNLVIGLFASANELIRGIVKLTFYAECYDPVAVNGS